MYIFFEKKLDQHFLCGEKNAENVDSQTDAD